MTVHDIRWGIVGESDYGGPQPGSIVFDEVEKLEFSIAPLGRKLSVYGVEVNRAVEGGFEVVVNFAPGGRLGLRCGVVDQTLAPAS